MRLERNTIRMAFFTTTSGTASQQQKMNVIADVCVVPIGVGVSLSKYIVACEEVFREAGLDPHIHAYGTNVEGELGDILAAIRNVHETLHEEGVVRIATAVKIGTRTDKEPSLSGKLF